MSATTWPYTKPPSAVFSLLRQSQHRQEVSSQNLCVQMVHAQDLDQARIDAWHALESRALEGNPFLSPSFVLPAMRYLTPHLSTVLLFVSRRDRPHELIAMAAFEAHGPSHRVPVPHLRAYKTPHSFLSGVLLDRRMPETGARALVNFLWSMRWRWQAIEWIECSDHSPQAHILSEAARTRGMHWHSYSHTQRAALYPSKLAPQIWRDHFSRKDRRNLERRIRRLGEQGELAYNCHFPSKDEIHQSERFLDLENMGWKGKQNTSLAASPSDAPFFREMFSNFASRGRGFVTAMELDGEAIAMSANLRSGQDGFTFKIGWDPAFRAQAPGILLGAQMLQHASRDFGTLDMVDSCADPGSFVERLWPTRRALKSGIHTMGPISTGLVRGARRLQAQRAQWSKAPIWQKLRQQLGRS